MADLAGEGGSSIPDTELIIQQAIESVLYKAPDAAPEPGPEEGKAQPWAETAAPPGKNKRPMEELLDDYARRVAASPGALAASPGDKRSSEAFFERLTRRSADDSRPGRGRRGRQRPGRGQGQPGHGGGRAPQNSGRPPRGSSRPPQGRPKPIEDKPSGAPGEGAGAGRRRRGRRRRR